jgi:hypothetical protein
MAGTCPAIGAAGAHAGGGTGGRTSRKPANCLKCVAACSRLPASCLLVGEHFVVVTDLIAFYAIVERGVVRTRNGGIDEVLAYLRDSGRRIPLR